MVIIVVLVSVKNFTGKLIGTRMTLI